MAASVPQALQSCHELLLWLIPQLDKFHEHCLRPPLVSLEQERRRPLMLDSSTTAVV